MALSKSGNQPLSEIPKIQTLRATIGSVRIAGDPSGQVRRSLFTDLVDGKGGQRDGKRYALGTARPSGHKPYAKSAPINGIVSDERW